MRKSALAVLVHPSICWQPFLLCIYCWLTVGRLLTNANRNRRRPTNLPSPRQAITKNATLKQSESCNDFSHDLQFFEQQALMQRRLLSARWISYSLMQITATKVVLQICVRGGRKFGKGGCFADMIIICRNILMAQINVAGALLRQQRNFSTTSNERMKLVMEELGG